MSTQTGTDRASDERERKLSKLSRRNRDLVQRVMVRHPLLTVEEAIEVADVGRHVMSTQSQLTERPEERERLLSQLRPEDRRLVENCMADFPVLTAAKAIQILTGFGGL